MTRVAGTGRRPARRRRMLVAAVLLLGLAALAQWPGATDGRAGADQQAMAAALALAPDYRPWVASWWQPSPVTERLLFALQAALGLAVLGFAVARLRRRRGIAAAPPSPAPQAADAEPERQCG
jgi:cobalt/nickel transport protein